MINVAKCNRHFQNQSRLIICFAEANVTFITFNCIVCYRSLILFRFFIFQPLKSGTTAVCTLVRGNTLYSAWLGDSQSVLVRNGYPVKVVEPHKPNRPVRLYEYWNHNTKYVVLLKNKQHILFLKSNMIYVICRCYVIPACLILFFKPSLGIIW